MGHFPLMVYRIPAMDAPAAGKGPRPVRVVKGKEVVCKKCQAGKSCDKHWIPPHPGFIGGHRDFDAVLAHYDPRSMRYIAWRQYVAAWTPQRVLDAAPTKARPMMLSAWFWFKDGVHADVENCRKALLDAIWLSDKHTGGYIPLPLYDAERPEAIVFVASPGEYQLYEGRLPHLAGAIHFRPGYGVVPYEVLQDLEPEVFGELRLAA